MGKAQRIKQGGWRSPSGLEWSQVKDIYAIAYRGNLNTVLDIMPMEGTDAERKRHCSRVVAHLGQRLQRRGRSHVGVTTYEKKLGVDVHGHHLCRVERQDKDLLALYDGHVVKAKMFLASERNDMVWYCTKQRLPLSPEFEKNTSHRRVKGLPIRSKRASYTAAAEALIRSSSTSIIAAKPQPAPETAALKAMGQLFLFPELEKPVARLRAFTGGILSPSAALELEYHRRRRGLSQQQLGMLAGLSQPTLANAVRGRFGLSRQAANRIREILAA